MEMPKPSLLANLCALVFPTGSRKPEGNGKSKEQQKPGNHSDYGVQVCATCGFGLESLALGSMGGLWIFEEELGGSKFQAMARAEGHKTS